MSWWSCWAVGAVVLGITVLGYILAWLLGRARSLGAWLRRRRGEI